MIDPYRMILVNSISLLIVAIGSLLYRYVYPKKNINLLFLLLVLSFLPLISLLRKGTYESGDLSLHSKFAMMFFDSLKEGIILPRWAGINCYGYGCPDFIFMYLIPYYGISFFHFIGFSFIVSVKLLLAFAFILSGIGVYLWIKQEIGKTPAFVAAIFYLYAPYHLVNLHFRVDIAETVAMAIIPYSLLFSSLLIKKPSIYLFITNGILLFLIILSHHAVSLSFFIFLLAYCMFTTWLYKKHLSYLIYCFFSLLFGVSIAAFYWLPIIFESKYILWGNIASTSFQDITEFLYSPYRYGLLFQGPKGELSFLIGYIQWIVICLALILLIKKRPTKNSKLLFFFTVSFFITFFMMQKISSLLWNTIPLIKNFQMSYRLLTLSSLFTAVLAGLVTLYKKNAIVTAVIVCIAIISTIINWGNRRAIPEIDDNYLRQELIKESLGESLVTPKWVDFQKKNIYKKTGKPMEVIKGEADITSLTRTSIYHEYIVHAKTDVLIKENTFYYPGWSTKINNNSVPVNYVSNTYPGIITFNAPKGLYKVELSFEPTPVRSIAQYISLISLSMPIMFLLFTRKIKR